MHREIKTRVILNFKEDLEFFKLHKDIIKKAWEARENWKNDNDNGQTKNDSQGGTKDSSEKAENE